MISRTEAPAGVSAADAQTETPLGESRWPPVVALLVFMALNIAVRVWLPREGVARLPWVLPAIEAVLLLALVVGNPSRLARRTRWAHRIAVTLVVVLVVAALLATGLLVYDLIRGRGVSSSASQLLASGALVWLGNNLAFAMLYWLIDSGGPIARSQDPTPVDFAFTQHMSPRARAAGLEARLPRLPASRIHERDGVQPHRRDATHPPSEMHHDRAVNSGARALRTDRGASRQRLHLVQRGSADLRASLLLCSSRCRAGRSRSSAKPTQSTRGLITVASTPPASVRASMALLPAAEAPKRP